MQQDTLHNARPVMNIVRLPVQVKSGCNAFSEIMRSEAIPLELFGQSEDIFNASSTAFAGHTACAAGEPFDSCINCPFHRVEQNRCDKVSRSIIMSPYGNGESYRTYYADGLTKGAGASTHNGNAFCKGDLVWYTQRDGSYKAAKVIKAQFAALQACHAQQEGAPTALNRLHGLKQRYPQ